MIKNKEAEREAIDNIEKKSGTNPQAQLVGYKTQGINKVMFTKIITTGIGRRKEAVALVRLVPGYGQIIINTKLASDFFKNDPRAKKVVFAPFKVSTKALNPVEHYPHLSAPFPFGLLPQKGLSPQGFSLSLPPASPFWGKSPKGSAGGSKRVKADKKQGLKNQTYTEAKKRTAKNLSFNAVVTVKGGGIQSQVEAIRLGISKAMCSINKVDLETPKKDFCQQKHVRGYKRGFCPERGRSLPQALLRKMPQSLRLIDTEKLKTLLRAEGYLTRDSRVKERKKYGLKKARKAPQYHKR